jgi:hypothetical protein
LNESKDCVAKPHASAVRPYRRRAVTVRETNRLLRAGATSEFSNTTLTPVSSPEPGVIDAAAAHGLQSAMTGIVGDFFDQVPAADFHLLKFVLMTGATDIEPAFTFLRDIGHVVGHAAQAHRRNQVTKVAGQANTVCMSITLYADHSDRL